MRILDILDTISLILLPFCVFQNPLGNNIEMYFVEQEATTIKKEFRRELRHIAVKIGSRNTSMSIMYENLVPTWIPNAAEPLPFCPQDIAESANDPGAIMPLLEKCRTPHIFSMSPSVPLMTLPICMQVNEPSHIHK